MRLPVLALLVVLSGSALAQMAAPAVEPGGPQPMEQDIAGVTRPLTITLPGGGTRTYTPIPDCETNEDCTFYDDRGTIESPAGRVHIIHRLRYEYFDVLAVLPDGKEIELLEQPHPNPDGTVWATVRMDELNGLTGVQLFAVSAAGIAPIGELALTDESPPSLAYEAWETPTRLRLSEMRYQPDGAEQVLPLVIERRGSQWVAVRQKPDGSGTHVLQLTPIPPAE